jgi:hypothetical protein
MKGIAGRVYQLCAGESMVAIDWNPTAPILGHDVLTGGEAALHPTEGRVVYFPDFRRREGRTTIAVRTGARPDLLELFELAMAMKRELTCELSAARREHDGPRTLAGARARGQSSQFVQPGLRAVSADGIK